MILPSVTECLGPYYDFSNVPAHRMEEGRIRGSAVHQWNANYALGIWSPPLPGEYRGYTKSFKDWFNEFVCEVLLVEERLIDADLGFTGKPDIVVILKGEEGPIVPDYKTAAAPGNQLRVWQAQNAAYLHLVNKRGIPAKRGGDLLLKADGSTAQFIPCENSPEAFAAFLSALNAYRYFMMKK
jgi:hypothetical protein